MKLSAAFSYNYEYNDKIDEFNISFDKTSNTEKLVKFIETYPDKTINIMFEDENDILNTLIIANSKHENIKLCLRQDQEQWLINHKQELSNFYYFLTFVNNFQQLSVMAHHNVSDVYITGELWHFADAVKDYCNTYDMAIRLVANLPQVISVDTNFEDPTVVIARPEDIKIWEKYVDIIEFRCGDPLDKSYFKILYHAWFETHKWIGPLDDLYVNMPYKNVINTNITTKLIQSALNCKYRCMTSETSRCRLCHDAIALARTAQEKGVELKFNG